MTSSIVKSRPRREAKNTYDLPQGEAIRRECVRWFRAQRDAMLEYLRTGKKAEAPPLPSDLPDWDFLGLGALAESERMTPILRVIWDQAGTQFSTQIGLDPDSWSVVNPKTADAISKAALDFCNATMQTTSLDLQGALDATRKELAAGVIERGESLRQLTKRINKVFDQAETYRARRIAASEASRAVHSAQEMQAMDSGVVTGWRWLLSSDACPLCQTIARRVPAVKLGQAFAVVGDNPTYSQVRMPPAHPSCQCTAVPVLYDEEQPRWAHTLHQPEPEEEDYAEGEAPAKLPKVPKLPPGETTPGIFRLPARHPMRATPAEPIGEYLPSDEAIAKPKKPKPPKAPPKPKAPKEASFPASVDGLEHVRNLGGSTGARLVKDPKTGKLYVQKRGANEGHLREEAHADALYRALGIDVPESRIYEHATGPIKLSQFHEGVTLGSLERSDPAAYAAAVERLRKGFAADALLGNWDVIGASADNVLVTADGKVLRIDNGGSLRYRAMGGKKSSGQWSGVVNELATLRDKNVNPAAAKVFAGITDAEIRAQVKAIGRAKSRLLAAAPEELRGTLGERIEALQQFGKPPKLVKVGNWKPKPADLFQQVSPGNLHDWGERYYKEWREALSPGEKAAVKDYTGSGYRKLNKYLRGITKTPPDNASIVPYLDAALNAKPVPHDMVVYRGTSLEDVLKGSGLTDRASLRPGMDLIDKGYTSTSPVIDSAWSGEKFEIRVHKGTPGAWVDPISSNQGEKEFILGRDVDTFRVVEMKPDRIVVEALRSEDLAKAKPKRRSRAKKETP